MPFALFIFGQGGLGVKGVANNRTVEAAKLDEFELLLVPQVAIVLVVEEAQHGALDEAAVGVRLAKAVVRLASDHQHVLDEDLVPLVLRVNEKLDFKSNDSGIHALRMTWVAVWSEQRRNVQNAIQCRRQ